MSGREAPMTRGDFQRFSAVPTRWHDNDVYGHVNNVVYYAFFDTAVNRLLVEAGTLDVLSSGIVGLVAETRCVYFAAVSFPETVEIGVRVAHLGHSSVRYRLAVFKAGEDSAAAQADYIHVYVERATQRPVEMPAAVRRVLEQLMR